MRWRGVQKLWGGPNSCTVMGKRLKLVMHLETPSDEEAFKFGHAPGKLKQHRDARARRKAGEWNRGRWLETRTGRGACDNAESLELPDALWQRPLPHKLPGWREVGLKWGNVFKRGATHTRTHTSPNLFTLQQPLDLTG